MNATLYFHARSENNLACKIVAKPPTGDTDTAYFEFHVGDVVMFLSDEQRRQLCDVLTSAPPRPQSDAQIDAEREENATAIPGAGDVETPAAGYSPHDAAILAVALLANGSRFAADPTGGPDGEFRF